MGDDTSMLSMHDVYRRYGGPVCRACLNEMTGVHLKRKNCVYLRYPEICPRCHVHDKNLVGKLKLSGKLKTLFRSAS